jgi:hypothetical protein
MAPGRATEEVLSLDSHISDGNKDADTSTVHSVTRFLAKLEHRSLAGIFLRQGSCCECAEQTGTESPEEVNFQKRGCRTDNPSPKDDDISYTGRGLRRFRWKALEDSYFLSG